MPYYLLKIPFSGLLEVEVEADTPEDAIDAALEDEIAMIPIEEACSDDVIEVRIERWEMHESVEDCDEDEDVFFGGETCVVVREIDDE